MKSENRRGKEFSNEIKKKRKKEVNYCCEGCGKRITTTRREHTCTEALELHHEQPISLGGDRRTKARVLCGPNMCHQVADDLAQQGVYFSELEQQFGEHPLQPYRRKLWKGKKAKVERRLLKRLGKAS